MMDELAIYDALPGALESLGMFGEAMELRAAMAGRVDDEGLLDAHARSALLRFQDLGEDAERMALLLRHLEAAILLAENRQSQPALAGDNVISLSERRPLPDPSPSSLYHLERSAEILALICS